MPAHSLLPPQASSASDSAGIGEVGLRHVPLRGEFVVSALEAPNGSYRVPVIAM
jgi:hypothetical protein